MLCPDAPSVRQMVIEHHFDAYVSKLPDTEFTAPTRIAATAAGGTSETRRSPAEEEEEEEEKDGAQPSSLDAASASPSFAASTTLEGEPLLGFAEEIVGDRTPESEPSLGLPEEKIGVWTLESESRCWGS